MWVLRYNSECKVISYTTKNEYFKQRMSTPFTRSYSYSCVVKSFRCDRGYYIIHWSEYSRDPSVQQIICYATVFYNLKYSVFQALIITREGYFSRTWNFFCICYLVSGLNWEDSTYYTYRFTVLIDWLNDEAYCIILSDWSWCVLTSWKYLKKI